MIWWESERKLQTIRSRAVEPLQRCYIVGAVQPYPLDRKAELGLGQGAVARRTSRRLAERITLAVPERKSILVQAWLYPFDSDSGLIEGQEEIKSEGCT